MDKTVFIYALTCPDTGEVKYVGKANDSQGRLRKHIEQREPLPTPKSDWIKSLLILGKCPVMVILEEVPFAEWESSEKRWIKYYLSNGVSLTNVKNGSARCIREEASIRKPKVTDNTLVKVWKTTERLAKILAAHCGVPLVELLHQLILEEIERKGLTIE